MAPAKAACGSWSLIHGPCTKSNTQGLCPPRGGTPFSNALTRPHRPAEALIQFHKPPRSSHSITGLGLVTVPSLKCRFPPNSLATPPRSPLQAALQGWALSPLSLFPLPPLTWWSYYLTAVMTIYKGDSRRTQLTTLFLSFLNVKCTLPTDIPLLISRRP